MSHLRDFIRGAALLSLKTCGLFELVKNSRWRQQRLAILCYHGVALDDEHQWQPALFISKDRLEQRLEILRRGNYSVLTLQDALAGLSRGALPPRSVVLTFDDGTYDFYRHCHPLLKQYGFPATVYLSTYYSGRPYPVFSLICSYMLWKCRELQSVCLGNLGLHGRFDLGREDIRQQIVKELIASSDRDKLTGLERNEIAAKLASALNVDYDELCRKRILQLMTPAEVSQLANDGVSFQLHTHRHRTPRNEELFRAEIRENREKIQKSTRADADHFCYPSGEYRPEFLSWLAAENVVSAVTCDTGLATSKSNPLLQPRIVDTSGRSELNFESWLSGIGHFLSRRKKARLAYQGRMS